MAIQGVGNPIDIAVTGMRAEGLRLKVISNNIANANTTRTPRGGPYRREELEVSTDPDTLSGVTIDKIVPDMSTNFTVVRMPGHPDADKNGYVRMPNVNVPEEMMRMVSASRAYQANAAVIKRYQDMMDVTTEILQD